MTKDHAAESIPVVVLMATYNGQAYLSEQIESLRAQTHANWALFVRDDGSSDRSLEIIEEYAVLDPRVHLLRDESKRLGPSGSFAKLLAHAREAPYVMLCDQDDVWNSDKIEQSLAAMLHAESSHGSATPIAIHTDLALVGAQLEPLQASMKRHMGFEEGSPLPFARLLAQNFVTGCTMMLNRSCVQAALPIPETALMHDWWIALVAAAVGELVYLPHVTMQYRQHGKNASGAAQRKGALEGAREFAGKLDSFEALMKKRFRQMEALESSLSRYPENSRTKLLREFRASLRDNRFVGILTGLRSGIRMQGLGRSTAYYFLLLKNGYPFPAKSD